MGMCVGVVQVKLAYSQGEWASQVGKQLHDIGDFD
jgi:hypothetical protein